MTRAKANGWRTLTLGDVLRIKHGFAFKGEFFSESGPYVLLTPGNFYDEGGFKHKDKEKYYTGPVSPQFVLDRGDLLVAMTEQKDGLLGSSAIVPEGDRFLHNQRLGLVTDLDAATIDKHFLYYLFNHRSVRDQIRATANGAKVRHTSPSRIYEVKVRLPPLRSQHKIAAILDAYDGLIENNLRRIQILEEMAQALYREWFVNFRFPGHMKTRMVNSPLGKIPEGWEVTKVSDAFEISGGGTPSKKVPEYWDEGNVNWYVPSDLTKAGTMFVDKSGTRITELGLKKSSARMFPAFSVMMTSRATIGVVAINTTPACTNQGFITCLPNDRVPLYYLYHWVRSNTDTFSNLASGATFKEIIKRVFKKIDFLLPPATVLSAFEELARPIAEEMLNLQRKNDNLRQTRDLLLPKLISDEVDVSALDIRGGVNSQG